MANVTLPSVNTSEQDPATLVKQLLNAYIMLTEELTYLLNNLDTRNINELNADIINAGTINANLVQIKSALAANGFIQIDGSGMKINDGAKDTFRADINGQVTMTGAKVQSKDGGFPRVEMNPDQNMFAAYSSPSSYINIASVGNVAGSPQFTVAGGGGSMFLYQQASQSVMSASNYLTIKSSSDIDLQAGFLGSVNIPFDTLVDFGGLNTSLYQQLNSKVAKGSETGYAGPYNGGIPIGTELVTADGGTVTWVGIAAHSHTVY